MRKLTLLLSVFITAAAGAQETGIKNRSALDTVMIIALGKKTPADIPFPLERVKLKLLQATPAPALMIQLSQLPAISRISSGNGINKPVIRGLSFNHIQLFASGTRIDNQTWDDRHDLGISDNGFDLVEIVTGPAALVYGPNTLGGAIVFSEAATAAGEKNTGYLRTDFFGNSLGGNVNAGYKGSHPLAGKKDAVAAVKNRLLYYSANAGFQLHTNYVQGKGPDEHGGEDDDKPLAGNSKFNSIAFKGMIGIKNSRSDHRLTYNLYKQNLGIIEDESADSAAATGEKEEDRDYDLEAPYQDVTTQVLSLENHLKTGHSEIIFNAGYQYNRRLEFEPDSLPDSQFLGVALNLQTVTADLQWHSNAARKTRITAGAQGFYQANRNFGNYVLVPDADVYTGGIFIIGSTDLKRWNFLYGTRADVHEVDLSAALPKRSDAGTPPALPAPSQDISRTYVPFSFSAGTVYHISKTLGIKINVANGNAAPNYAQLAAFGKHEGTYRFEIGDNNLRQEKNFEEDLALDFSNAAVSFTLSGYLNTINKYIFIAPTADSAGNLRVYRWTQHNARINGIEGDLEFHPARTPRLSSYLRTGIIAGKLTGGAGYLPYIPANKIIAGFTYNKSLGEIRELTATLQGSYYGRQARTAQFESSTDGYFLGDVFVGVKPQAGKSRHLRYTAFCTNLFNKGYFNHLSLIKAIGVREPGRCFGLQAEYDF